MKKIIVIMLVVIFTLGLMSFVRAEDKGRLWERINYLVPNPHCATSGQSINDYDKIEWWDVRALPSKAELEAITTQQLVDNKATTATTNTFNTKLNKTLADILCDQENRIRVLEGLSPISKAICVINIKTIYNGN